MRDPRFKFEFQATLEDAFIFLCGGEEEEPQQARSVSVKMPTNVSAYRNPADRKLATVTYRNPAHDDGDCRHDDESQQGVDSP